MKRKKNRSNKRRTKVNDKSSWNYNEESVYASIKKKKRKNKNEKINNSVFAYIATPYLKKSHFREWIETKMGEKGKKRKEERNQTTMVNNRNACLFPALMSPLFFGRGMPFFRASDPRKKRRGRDALTKAL